jgi:hypothetical protein
LRRPLSVLLVDPEPELEPDELVDRRPLSVLLVEPELELDEPDELDERRLLIVLLVDPELELDEFEDRRELSVLLVDPEPVLAELVFRRCASAVDVFVVVVEPLAPFEWCLFELKLGFKALPLWPPFEFVLCFPAGVFFPEPVSVGAAAAAPAATRSATKAITSRRRERQAGRLRSVSGRREACSSAPG